jgi:hypothetical protein
MGVAQMRRFWIFSALWRQLAKLSRFLCHSESEAMWFPSFVCGHNIWFESWRSSIWMRQASVHHRCRCFLLCLCVRQILSGKRPPVHYLVPGSIGPECVCGSPASSIRLFHTHHQAHNRHNLEVNKDE